MNRMQQQTMNPPPTPLNLVTTKQIQKYLDDNKNLIMAILENQNLGKIAECVQYQDVLQKNLTYLMDVVDAQPQGPQIQSQVPAGSSAQQGNPHTMQGQVPTMQQQTGIPAAKTPFQLNPIRPQNQQNHLLHLQQQRLQAQFSLGGVSHNGLHLLMQHGIGGSGSFMDLRGSQPRALESGSGNVRGNSSLPSAEGRE